MKDPSYALEIAAVAAIETKLAATYPSAVVVRDPVPGQAEPYVEYEGASILEPFDTKTTEGAETVQRFIAWSKDADEATICADLVLQALTNRASLLAPTGHSLLISRQYGGSGLDLALKDQTTGVTFYGKTVAVRHVTEES